MIEVDAFSLLEQLAKLQKLGAQLQQEREGWTKNARALRHLASEAHLTTIRDSLTDVALALELVVETVNRHLEVVHAENAALKERLKGVAIKQADLEEIRRRQAEGARPQAPRPSWAAIGTGGSS